MKTQALKRLKTMAALSKQEIQATIQAMVDGLGELGEVSPQSKLDFNIGETEARQTINVKTNTRAVSNFFMARGFRHLSSGMMRKGIGDSIATVNFYGAGGFGVAVTLKVYSQRA